MKAAMSDFEQKVLSDLAEVKAHMRWLVGNGNEGKMQELEERVGRHEAFLQRFTRDRDGHGVPADGGAFRDGFSTAVKGKQDWQLAISN